MFCTWPTHMHIGILGFIFQSTLNISIDDWEHVVQLHNKISYSIQAVTLVTMHDAPILAKSASKFGSHQYPLKCQARNINDSDKGKGCKVEGNCMLHGP